MLSVAATSSKYWVASRSPIFDSSMSNTKRVAPLASRCILFQISITSPACSTNFLAELLWKIKSLLL